MNIFKRFANTITNTPITPQTITLTNNGVQGSIFAELSLSSNALSNSGVLRGINAISNAVASMKAYEYQIINNEKIRTYTTLDHILNVSPNNNMSAFTFKKQIIENAFIHGNSIIKIERDLNNTIISLSLLSSQLLTCRYNQNDNTAKYYYNGKELDMSDYILFYVYNDKNYNGYFGQSLHNYANEVLKKTNFLNSYQNNFFNGGSISGILTPKADRVLPQEIANKAKKDFISQSASNSVIVMDGDFQYQKFATNAKDAMLLELSLFSISEIARVMNIPPSFLFDGNNTISEDDRLLFYSETLQPILENLENQFENKFYFKKDWGKKHIEFDYYSLLKTNKNVTADYYSKLFSLGVVSPNDICRGIGLPTSSEDGSDNRYILQNSQPLSINLNAVKAGLINETKQ